MGMILKFLGSFSTICLGSKHVNENDSLSPHYFSLLVD